MLKIALKLIQCIFRVVKPFYDFIATRAAFQKFKNLLIYRLSSSKHLCKKKKEKKINANTLKTGPKTSKTAGALNCRHIGYSFQLAERLFYMHHPTDRIAHTMAFVTPVVEHWLE